MNTGQAFATCGVIPYPEPIADTGYHGLAGEYIRFVAPHTEADPNFMLLYLLAAAGSVIGRGPHVRAGGDRHYANLYVCAVGSTSRGRKGSASGPVERLFALIDPAWRTNIRAGGLSTGEGVISAVHDAVYARQKTEKGYIDVVTEPDVVDKRLFVRQTELHGALQNMRKEGNTLSSVLREAWDKGELSTLTRQSPMRATNAHVSIVAGITAEELRHNVDAEIHNGFANRFLWCCSRQSKLLPSGGRLFDLDLSELGRRFALAIDAAKSERHIARDPHAEEIWGRDGSTTGMYADLNTERPGLWGIVTARAAPQVLRLALIFALLDARDQIGAQHLRAAREVWRYCDDSARYVFGESLGNRTADEILAALRVRHELTRDQVRQLFGGHKSSTDLREALACLARLEIVDYSQRRTGGRTAEIWSLRNGGGARKAL
jgi:Protein of unknown function (DUF3987)